MHDFYVIEFDRIRKASQPSCCYTLHVVSKRFEHFFFDAVRNAVNGSISKNFQELNSLFWVIGYVSNHMEKRSVQTGFKPSKRTHINNVDIIVDRRAVVTSTTESFFAVIVKSCRWTVEKVLIFVYFVKCFGIDKNYRGNRTVVRSFETHQIDKVSQSPRPSECTVH